MQKQWVNTGNERGNRSRGMNRERHQDTFVCHRFLLLKETGCEIKADNSKTTEMHALGKV